MAVDLHGLTSGVHGEESEAPRQTGPIDRIAERHRNGRVIAVHIMTLVDRRVIDHLEIVIKAAVGIRGVSCRLADPASETRKPTGRLILYTAVITAVILAHVGGKVDAISILVAVDPDSSALDLRIVLLIN